MCIRDRPSTLKSNLATRQPRNTLSLVRPITSRTGLKEAVDLVQPLKTETTSVGTVAAKAADQEQAAKDREAFATEKHRLEPTSTYAGQKQARSIEQQGCLQQASLGAISPAINISETSKSTTHCLATGDTKRSYGTTTTPSSSIEIPKDIATCIEALRCDLGDVREHIAEQHTVIASIRGDVREVLMTQRSSRNRELEAQYQADLAARSKVPEDGLLFFALKVVLVPIYAVAHGFAFILVAFVGMGMVVFICEGLAAGYGVVKALYIGRVDEVDE